MTAKTYTNDKPLRTTTRARATAEAIRDRVPFVTSGAFSASTIADNRVEGKYIDLWPSYAGHLGGVDLAWWEHDVRTRTIDYVVYSYSTPIAWHMSDGTWHRVGQSFSATTGKHQGNLYLIERPDHEVRMLKDDGDWSVWCSTCRETVAGAHYKADASRLAHTHRIAGRLGVAPPARG